jgi:hypothetical protein
MKIFHKRLTPIRFHNYRINQLVHVGAGRINAIEPLRINSIAT